MLTGLFYYAGHGYEHAGRNYLVAIDAPQPYRPENCVCVQRIVLSMQKKHTALSLILLDTCRKWLVLDFFVKWFPFHTVNIRCTKYSNYLFLCLLVYLCLYSKGIIRTVCHHASCHWDQVGTLFMVMPRMHFFMNTLFRNKCFPIQKQYI